MKWVEIAISTTPQAAEAVANILLECRIGGVIEESPAPGAVVLRGFLPVGPAIDVTLSAISRRVLGLPQFGLDIGPGTVDTTFVEDEAWARAWKSYFKAFRLGRRLWITPTWDLTPPPPEAIVIELDPGMAFGSGLHASTQLCLLVLEERLRGGERVFDVGTGSGILAIAAAKLGAGSIHAVDVDPVAVEVARKNAAHNGVADRVVVREGNLLEGVEGRASLILANLTADLLLDFLPSTGPYLERDGVFVASGIVADRLLEVRAVAEASGFRVLDEHRDDEWRCLILAGVRGPGSEVREPEGG